MRWNHRDICTLLYVSLLLGAVAGVEAVSVTAQYVKTLGGREPARCSPS